MKTLFFVCAFLTATEMSSASPLKCRLNSDVLGAGWVNFESAPEGPTWDIAKMDIDADKYLKVSSPQFAQAILMSLVKKTKPETELATAIGDGKSQAMSWFNPETGRTLSAECWIK